MSLEGREVVRTGSLGIIREETEGTKDLRKERICLKKKKKLEKVKSRLKDHTPKPLSLPKNYEITIILTTIFIFKTDHEEMKSYLCCFFMNTNS